MVRVSGDVAFALMGSSFTGDGIMSNLGLGGTFLPTYANPKRTRASACGFNNIFYLFK
jgi:hypothetical protein